MTLKNLYKGLYDPFKHLWDDFKEVDQRLMPTCGLICHHGHPGIEIIRKMHYKFKINVKRYNFHQYFGVCKQFYDLASEK